MDLSRNITSSMQFQPNLTMLMPYKSIRVPIPILLTQWYNDTPPPIGLLFLPLAQVYITTLTWVRLIRDDHQRPRHHTSYIGQLQPLLYSAAQCTMHLSTDLGPTKHLANGPHADHPLSLRSANSKSITPTPT